jgi:serine/threonine protein kinase/WD40 repeat protein
VPADLPAEPLASYNPTLVRRGPNEAGDELIETMAQGRPPSSDQTNQPSKTGVLKPGEASQAEALGFRMLRMVGRGGMGEVWEAVQRRLGRIVAVKRLRKHRASDSSYADGTQTVARMFEAEARISALLDHPNIVPVYDLGFDESGAPLLAMKMVSGTGWNFLLNADFPELSPDEHLAKHIPILAQLSQAISFAHSKGVIHRDLKPSQVMVGDYGEVLLLDWGLACMVGDQTRYPREEGESIRYPSAESADNPAGTPAYMAPEQTESHSTNIGPWTDVYLLGGILYQILTGLRPHPGDTSDQAFRNATIGMYIPFVEAGAGREFPEELCALADLALNPVTAERPTAKQFYEAIQDYLTGASRRRESAAITEKLRTKQSLRTYAEFVEALGSLGQAQRLWPGNPEAAALRESIVEGYTRLALSTGDLTLARAQGERLQSVEAREKILAEVKVAEDRVAVRRRRLVQLTVATIILVVLMFTGGTFFTLQLKKAGEATKAQLVLTETAKAAEAAARKKAQQESERAILLLADSLVSQNRREEAIEELLRIPEEGRFWEWEFVLTRALNELWVSPFEYMAFSPTKNFAVGFEATRGLCLLRAESGEELVQLADSRLDPPVVAYSRDEGRLAYYDGAGKIGIVDTKMRNKIEEVPGLEGQSVTAIEFSPDETSLGIGYASGDSEIYEIATGKRTPLTPHYRFIQGIYWGKKAIIVASSNLVVRTELEGGNATVLFESSAVTGGFKPFHCSSDMSRKYFCFGYDMHQLQYGEVDDGGLIELHELVDSMLFCEKNPWLILCLREYTPHIKIWDLEKREFLDYYGYNETDFSTKHLGAYLGSIARGPQLSADESKLMVNNEVFLHLRQFPSLASTSELNMTALDGLRIAVLTPAGDSFWGVRRDNRTVLRPLGTTYVGTNLPGNVSSFGAQDAYTAVIRENYFEQRDTTTGEVIFTGGNNYRLYLGSPTTEDLKTIYLPGYRGDQFTIEKSNRETGKLIAKFVIEEEIATLALDAETARLALLAPGGRELSFWSLEGEKEELLWRKSLPEGESGILRIVFSRSRQRMMILREGGIVSLWDCASGEEVKSVVAQPEGFTMLINLRSHNALVTGGTDGKILFSDNETLEPMNEFAFDFLPEDIAVSDDGEMMVASPAVGAPVVRDMKTGKDIVQLARTDFPMGNAKFIAQDTRILASAGGMARLWDPKSGIEVFNIDEGFGEVSSDSRSVIFKESEFDGTLLEIVPSKAGDFDAGQNKEFRELLDLWMIDRYKRWRIRRVRAQIPSSLKDIRNLPGTISDGGWRNLLGVLYVAIQNPHDVPVGRALDELTAHLVMSLSQTVDQEIISSAAEDGLWLSTKARPELLEGPVCDAVIVLGAYRAIEHVRNRAYYVDPFFPSENIRALELMGRAYLAKGDPDRATKVLLRASAIRQLSGFVPGETGRMLDSLGVPPPAPPSAEITYGPHTSAPPWFVRRLEALPPTLTREERWAAIEQLRREFGVIAMKYLDATPGVDWTAEIERIQSSPDWKGPPRDMSTLDFYDHVMSRLERVYYHGQTQAEAIAAERARLDELFRFKTEPVAE